MPKTVYVILVLCLVGVSIHFFGGEKKTEIISVEIKPRAVVADGVSKCRIIATVKNAEGARCVGHVLSFEIVKGTGAIEILAGVTNAKGIAIASYSTNQVPDNNETIIKVTDRSSNSSLSCKAKIKVLHPRVKKLHLSVNATPNRIKVASQETAMITARLTDENGRPLAGRMLRFKVISGGGTLFSLRQVTLVTDMEGKAIASYTPGKVTGIATIEVCDPSNPKVSGSVEIIEE